MVLVNCLMDRASTLRSSSGVHAFCQSATWLESNVLPNSVNTEGCLVPSGFLVAFHTPLPVNVWRIRPMMWV